MEIRYRIESWRPDVPTHISEEPIITGDTIEECDRRAKERLEKIVTAPSSAWDNFSLKRIDVPETSTFLARSTVEDRSNQAKEGVEP